MLKVFLVIYALTATPDGVVHRLVSATPQPNIEACYDAAKARASELNAAVASAPVGTVIEIGCGFQVVKENPA